LSYAVRVAPRAEAQIRIAASWWSENRPKAPGAFRKDIERGFELARTFPAAGERVGHSRYKEVRRILLGRIRYHLYYSVSRETRVVKILALWHTSRGSAPTL
jgi:plasmid stabilization system protein ParE